MANQPNNKKKPGAKKKARDEFEEEDIFQPPTITREPMSRQAKLGGKVVLRVTATGKPLPTFQWFHNGKKIVGASSDRLTLSKIRRQAAGAYHCEAKNFVGKAVSRVAMLSFFTQRIPKLVIGPEVLKIEEGKPFSLKVSSPAPADLKDFKIYWMFNGVRIKSAMGIELQIGGAKKKYEGEYKAIIATGSSIESSNVAKVKVVPAKSLAKEPGEPQPAVEAGLAAEPEPESMILEPQASTPSANDWESFLFNPEDEPESDPASLVAPIEGAEQFGHTSPGTPVEGQSAPLSQLATQDLIREVAAQGGVSELLEDVVPQEDPSGLIERAMGKEDPSILIEKTVAPEDPSALIQNEWPEPEKDPSRILEALLSKPDTPAPEHALAPKPTPAPVADARAKPEAKPEPLRTAIPIRKPVSQAPNPKLVRKKAFLEKALARFARERKAQKAA